MIINEQDLDELSTELRDVLSADDDERAEAEQILYTRQIIPNYSCLLLALCERHSTPNHIGQFAAIILKHFLKNNWPTFEQRSSTLLPISLPDQDYIKEHMVDSMLRSTENVQQELCNVITIIGKHDFPDRWPSLLPTMVQNLERPSFTAENFRSIYLILKTAHSLFDRYRYEMKSDKLSLEIKLVIERFAPTFKDLFHSLMSYYRQTQSNPAELKVIFKSIYLVVKIFCDFNALGSNEHFKKNCKMYMTHFLELLNSNHFEVDSHTEDSSPSIFDEVKMEICRAIALSVENYSEHCTRFVQQFLDKVGALIQNLGSLSSHDDLVCSIIRCLSTIVAHDSYRSILSQDNKIEMLFEKVIVPNLFLRDSEIEAFERSPEEYIRDNIELSGSVTRRGAIGDIVQALSVFFEDQVIVICHQYIETMKNQYRDHPSDHWVKMDGCIGLATALVSKTLTEKYSLTKTRSLISVRDFCSSTIFPEFLYSDIDSLPLIKAVCLKFLVFVRNQLDHDEALIALNQCARCLLCQNIVVQMYASYGIEQLLHARKMTDDKHPTINKTDLITLGQSMMTKLTENISKSNKSVINQYPIRAMLSIAATIDADDRLWKQMISFTTPQSQQQLILLRDETLLAVRHEMQKQSLEIQTSIRRKIREIQCPMPDPQPSSSGYFARVLAASNPFKGVTHYFNLSSVFSGLIPRFLNGKTSDTGDVVCTQEELLQSERKKSK